jgi:hypothetical protein
VPASIRIGGIDEDVAMQKKKRNRNSSEIMPFLVYSLCIFLMMDADIYFKKPYYNYHDFQRSTGY